MTCDVMSQHDPRVVPLGPSLNAVVQDFLAIGGTVRPTQPGGHIHLKK